MPLRSSHHSPINPLDAAALQINPTLVRRYLVAFLRDEVIRQRSMRQVVLGVSGGLDSAVVAYLCAEAFGPKNVFSFRMPYRLSSPASMNDAQLVIDDLGIQDRVISITQMVDGYCSPFEAELSPARLGNVCSRCRTVILFDQSMEIGGIPIGTGNKSERLLGYYTWHGDDAPPVNPLGDLFKTQVFALARELGVPEPILAKPPSADLIQGQTDEGDYGVTYAEIDVVLNALIQGFSREAVVKLGISEANFDLINRRLKGTHWKRRPATVAMMSDSAIGEYYLRPVDYK